MKSLNKIVADVMHISAARVNARTSPQNVKRWDSLRGLLLIIAIENNFKIKLTTRDIMSIRNLGDIKTILKRYRVRCD